MDGIDSRTLSFTKMHGLGNDFVVLDHLDTPPSPAPEPAAWRRLADRRLGVGCDQVVQLLAAADRSCQATMRIFNPDGSEAEMCGNAARCVALYLVRHRGANGADLRLHTQAGVIRMQMTAPEEVTVDMGVADLDGHSVADPWSGTTTDYPLTLADTELRLTGVSMGNPHCVAFVPEVDRFPLERIGPLVEHHPIFPRRTNFECVQVLDRQRLRMRVWERGAGITPACGTGACAAWVAAAVNGLTERRGVVVLDGGTLEIAWLDNGRVLMTGSATEVFWGQWPLP